MQNVKDNVSNRFITGVDIGLRKGGGGGLGGIFVYTGNIFPLFMKFGGPPRGPSLDI